MAHLILRMLAGLCGILALCGVGYLMLTVWSIRRHLRRVVAVGASQPPISILKPLHGIDPEMYESFRSHCIQKYPEFEIIFGVNDATDPAVEAVERLRCEFPSRRIELVICGDVRGTNRKVSNLIQMLGAARHDHIVINDSDIRVPADYLAQIAKHFADPKVGMVTALYRAVADRTVSSKLEALTIATDFSGGVLCAIEVDDGMKFALGSTLALPRRVLNDIGGFAPLLDYLADDYELGVRTAKAGYEVRLADTVVETFLPPYTFAEMWSHQLRWSRTMREMRQAGYFGVVVTFALPWSVFAVLLSGGAAWAWALLLVSVVVRFADAYILCNRVVGDSRSVRDFWLLPLRDFVAMALWIASYTGNTVTWRGESFRLVDGKLIKIEDARRQ